MSNLALLGGEKTIQFKTDDLFKWPIVTDEMENAVLDVIRSCSMSGKDITKKFEREFAEWHGMTYGLGFNNGTASIQSTMFGIGIGIGDEIICPTTTYWASAMPVFSLGGSVVFADINPKTMNIDPEDIEQRISKKTKAIIVVHYCGFPANMDKIMKIANEYDLKVIEDVSHAHGALYKGKMVGTFGDAACFSCMTGKAFAIGEGGVMITNNREIYERAILWGHYSRHSSIESPELKKHTDLPWGGYKYRMHQVSAAVGRVQLKKYPNEMKEINKAMNYFWDILEDTPGIRAHRTEKGSGNTMGGWYNPVGRYISEELGGLSISRFCKAVNAEGVSTSPGCNTPLHLHPVFNNTDIYQAGKPTRIANTDRDLRQPAESLPVAENIQRTVFRVPWFKKFDAEKIKVHANAFRKVVENYDKLLEEDEGDPETLGAIGLTFNL